VRKLHCNEETVLIRSTEQINAARGRLKTILHRGLYDPVDRMLAKATCPYRETEEYFKGLCLGERPSLPSAASFSDTDMRLDCMNAPMTADTDREYWSYAERGTYKSSYGRKCRIGSHHEPSWYFSFIGRKETMMQFNGSQKRKRED